MVCTALSSFASAFCCGDRVISVQLRSRTTQHLKIRLLPPRSRRLERGASTRAQQRHDASVFSSKQQFFHFPMERFFTRRADPSTTWREQHVEEDFLALVRRSGHLPRRKKLVRAAELARSALTGPVRMGCLARGTTEIMPP